MTHMGPQQRSSCLFVRLFLVLSFFPLLCLSTDNTSLPSSTTVNTHTNNTAIIPSLSLTTEEDLPAPTFFISFHGGDSKKDVNDIYRYSLDGKLLQKKIFSDGVSKQLHGLRGLLYVESRKVLLITNSFKDDSRIIELDVSSSSPFACTGQGSADDFVVDGTVLHPYGIQLNPLDQTVTISNQGDPLNPPQNITQYDLDGNALVKTTFITIGDPRDLLWAAFGDTAYLFVCDKSTDRVVKFDALGQQLSFVAKVKNPIALHSVLPPPGEGVIPWLLVASNDPDDSAVFAVDFLTGGDTVGGKTTYKRKYADAQLGHPCGMASLGNTLYVLSQDTFALVAFDLTTAGFLSVVVSKLPDIPEDLMLVSLPACSLAPSPPGSLVPTSAAAETDKKGAVSKIPPVYFIATGATLGVALALGTILYWCKRRRDYRRSSNSKATPLTINAHDTEQGGGFETQSTRGSIQGARGSLAPIIDSARNSQQGSVRGSV